MEISERKRRAEEIHESLGKVKECVTHTINYLDLTDKLLHEFEEPQNLFPTPRRMISESIKHMSRIAPVEMQYCELFRRKVAEIKERNRIRSLPVSSDIQNREGDVPARKRKFTMSTSESEEAPKRCKELVKRNCPQDNQSAIIKFAPAGRKQTAKYMGKRKSSPEEFHTGVQVRKSKSVFERSTSQRQQRRERQKEFSAVAEVQDDKSLFKTTLHKSDGSQSERRAVESGEESISQKKNYLNSDVEPLHSCLDGKRLVICLNDVLKNPASENDPVLKKFKQSYRGKPAAHRGENKTTQEELCTGDKAEKRESVLKKRSQRRQRRDI